MNDVEYRSLLDLLMCSDPWPVKELLNNQAVLKTLADNEAMKRDYPDWIVAYHEMER